MRNNFEIGIDKLYVETFNRDKREPVRFLKDNGESRRNSAEDEDEKHGR